MSPDDVRNIVEGVKLLALIINVILIGVAILFMVDVERHARCRWCEHCRREIDKERDERARKRHVAYHAYTDRNSSACDNPECPGRK